MADNVVVTAGTGTTIAADELTDGTLGSVKVQFVKLMDGTLDGSSKAAVGANGLAVDVKASVIPTGAATSAKQDTGNTSVGNVDTNLGAIADASVSAGATGSVHAKLRRISTDISTIATNLPAQGQALAAASTPVVLTAAQVTTLTPPAAITGFATSAKQDTGNTSVGNIDTTLGAKADAKSTATDTTSISGISIWKQISASVQAIATSVAGTLTVASHAVTNAGTFAVQASEADGANVTLGSKADAKSTATDTTSITIMQVLKQISSSIQAAATSLAGTLTVASHAVTNAGTFAVQPTVSSTGGYTPGHLVSAATTNATSVQGSATTVGYITASNVNAAARYLKIYNKATAPTVGSDTPVHTFIIPGNTAGAGTNIPLPPQGIALGTGFAFALTTEATDAGSTGVAVSEIVINYGYK